MKYYTDYFSKDTVELSKKQEREVLSKFFGKGCYRLVWTHGDYCLHYKKDGKWLFMSYNWKQYVQHIIFEYPNLLD